MRFKIFSILLIVMCLVGLSANVTYAEDEYLKNVIRDMSGVGNVTNADKSQTKKVLNTVVRLIQIAGAGIAIIMIILLGIKYMLASPGAKAEYKKTAMPIVIGCLLLFAASFVAGVIAQVGDSFN